MVGCALMEETSLPLDLEVVSCLRSIHTYIEGTQRFLVHVALVTMVYGDLSQL